MVMHKPAVIHMAKNKGINMTDAYYHTVLKGCVVYEFNTPKDAYKWEVMMVCSTR